MKPSEGLFKLIKSLDKNEKGYFKKFSSLHAAGKENNYIKLFDAIAAQEVYDEAAIKKLFYKEIFIRQLTFTKNYLYHLLLKSMRVYHAQQSLDMQFQDLINDIRFFHAKGIYDECEKLVEKAKQMAKESYNMILLLEVFYWEKKLNIIKANYSALKQISEDEKKVLEQLENLRQYETLNDDFITQTIIHGDVRDKEVKINMERFLKHPLMKNENNAKSLRAKILYYQIFLIYYALKNDLHGQLKTTRICVDLWDKQGAQLIKIEPMHYLNCLEYYAKALINLEMYQDVIIVIEKMKQVPVHSVRTITGKFNRIAFLELIVYTNMGDFNKGLEIAEEIEKHGKKYRKQLNSSSEMYFYFAKSVLLFGTENYQDALKNLKKVFDINQQVLFPEIPPLAKVLSLIIHYEIGNHDLLPYAVISAYRFLTKRKRLHKTEDVLLWFLRYRISKIPSYPQSAAIDAFKELHGKLAVIAKDPAEKKILQYFDFMSWIESKIEKKSFAEIVKEKSKSLKLKQR